MVYRLELQIVIMYNSIVKFYKIYMEENMKKIILCVISVLAAAALLVGCKNGNGLPGVDTMNAPKTDSVKQSDYKNDLEGLEKYLNALGYIPDNCEPTKMTLCSVIGAKDGDRYNFNVDNAAVYVELYEYDTDNLNEEAKRVIGEIQKDGKYYVFGESSREDAALYEGNMSLNGKYMVSYTLTSNGDTNVQRKKDFINAVENYYK